jgi:hypothetical protein
VTAPGIAALILCCSSVAAGAERTAGERSEPRIHFHGSPEDERFGAVEVEGLDRSALDQLRRRRLDESSWKQLFPVFTAASLEAAAGLPPVLGRYEIGERTIRFVPRFPFAAGLDYTARFDGARFDESIGVAAHTPIIILTFQMPEPEPGPVTYIEAVYPSATALPENLLRLYVHFSAPMRARQVHRYVHLYNSDGDEVPLPFVEVQQGLWDPAQRRLTLLFHPGRVKRGVAPNRAMGPPLDAGATFRFVIDREFPDAKGERLAGGFEKEIRSVVADRASPNPSDWQVREPTGPGDGVELRFPEPLDHALLQRMIWVTGPAGERVDGTVTVGERESRWTFTPAAPWLRGEYTIVADSALEDLAGNRLDRLFDEKIVSPPAADRRESARSVPVARFVVR